MWGRTKLEKTLELSTRESITSQAVSQEGRGERGRGQAERRRKQTVKVKGAMTNRHNETLQKRPNRNFVIKNLQRYFHKSQKNFGSRNFYPHK